MEVPKSEAYFRMHGRASFARLQVQSTYWEFNFALVDARLVSAYFMVLQIESLNVLLADFIPKDRQTNDADEQVPKLVEENCKFYLTPEGEVYADPKATEDTPVSAQEAQAIASIETAYALVRIADKLDELVGSLKER